MPAPFVRAWPPSPDGVLPGGDRLGFLRYCPRTPTAALRVNVPKSSWLLLDPAVSAPNAVIGVWAGPNPPQQRTGWHFMTPGDVYYSDAPFYEFWLFNGDQLDQITGGLPIATRRPLGYVGFLVGQGPPPTRKGPTPMARIVQYGNPAEVNGILVPSGEVERLAVNVFAFDAGGNPAAADFGVQLSIAWAGRYPALSSTSLDSEKLDDPVDANIVRSAFHGMSLRSLNGSCRGIVETEGAFLIAIAQPAIIYDGAGLITQVRCLVEAAP